MTASTLFVNVGTVLRLLIRVHKSYLVNKNKISIIICIGEPTILSLKHQIRLRV